MREIIPAARIGEKLNKTLNHALLLEEFHIENIITPNIINLEQREKLQSIISMGIDRVKFLENELKNQWSSAKIRKDIWKISTGMFIIMMAVVIIGSWIVFRRFQKFRESRRGSCSDIETGNTHLDGTKVDEYLGDKSLSVIIEEKDRRNRKTQNSRKKGQ